MNYKVIKNCQICKSKLSKFIDLNEQPLCDDLRNKPNKNIFYKLKVNYCPKCLTAFQKYNINKQKLFPKNYHYRSANTKDVIQGMKDLVDRTEKITGKLRNKKVLDIGCNDGSLLDIFKNYGCKTYGIEPTGAAIEAIKKKHNVYNTFFDKKISKKLIKKFESFDVITFTNVFAHIENFNELIESLKLLIKSNTLLVIENHYFGEVLKKNQFDTFYHEHPRTYSLNSFYKISQLLNMHINDFNFVKRYNGNIRVFLSKKNNDKTFKKLKKSLYEERKITKLISKFQMKINRWKVKKRKELVSLAKIYGPLPAKAFPGRASILINLLKIDNTVISKIFEKDSSLKVNKFVPGTNIIIVKESSFSKTYKNKKVLLNLAWHISDEIRHYVRNKLKFKNKVIDIIHKKDFK
jgi:2-polyprenyl-3-methyl-5-hydroxy-6-metoxy-1,4-benzoquinol methylase